MKLLQLNTTVNQICYLANAYSLAFCLFCPATAIVEQDLATLILYVTCLFVRCVLCDKIYHILIPYKNGVTKTSRGWFDYHLANKNWFSIKKVATKCLCM